jgi:nitrogen fixation protein FixH
MTQGAGHMKYILIVVVIIGMSAIIGAIVVGEKSFEGIVVQHPYDEGLKRDAIIKAHQRLGWELVLTHQSYTVGHAEIGVRLLQADKKPLAGADVSLVVSRPNTDKYDRSYSAHEIYPGVYRADVDFALYGYWDLEFTIRKGKDELPFTKRIFAEQIEPK